MAVPTGKELAEQVVEHRKIIKALHQYMTSQGIDRKQWGLIFAKAAGYEVFDFTRKHGGSQHDVQVGATILMGVIRIWSRSDKLNTEVE